MAGLAVQADCDDSEGQRESSDTAADWRVKDQRQRDLYHKLVRKHDQKGGRGSWCAYFRPVLREAGGEGQPARALLSCIHCGKSQGASNPYRVYLTHIKGGLCKVFNAKLALDKPGRSEGARRASSAMATTAPANGRADSTSDGDGCQPAAGGPALGHEDLETETRLLTARVSTGTHAALKELSRAAGCSVGEVLDDIVQRSSQGAGPAEERPSKLRRASYEPQPHLRDVAIDPSRTALLFIDVQNLNCHPDGAIYRGIPDAPENTYWWQRLAETKPVWVTLQRCCRKAGVEVMYTVIQALTDDCRDMSVDYKISGFKVPPGSFDSEVLDCIRPAADEIVLPKTSCSVFRATNVDRVLQNLGVRHLILAGCLTDQCVESAVRDACDSNYYTTLVTDACATHSKERHENSLRAIKGFCRQKTCKQLIAEVEGILFSRREGMRF